MQGRPSDSTNRTRHSMAGMKTMLIWKTGQFSPLPMAPPATRHQYHLNSPAEAAAPCPHVLDMTHALHPAACRAGRR